MSHAKHQFSHQGQHTITTMNGMDGGGSGRCVWQGRRHGGRWLPGWRWQVAAHCRQVAHKGERDREERRERREIENGWGRQTWHTTVHHHHPTPTTTAPLPTPRHQPLSLPAMPGPCLHHPMPHCHAPSHHVISSFVKFLCHCRQVCGGHANVCVKMKALPHCHRFKWKSRAIVFRHAAFSFLDSIDDREYLDIMESSAGRMGKERIEGLQRWGKSEMG